MDDMANNVDKNTVKINHVCSIFSRKMMEWVQVHPTGKRTFTVEVNANQGGIGEMFVEEFERGKV